MGLMGFAFMAYMGLGFIQFMGLGCMGLGLWGFRVEGLGPRAHDVGHTAWA